MDWVNPISSQLAEEREEDMSSLTDKFIARVLKRAVSDQREITSIFEGPYDKRPKRSSLDEEVQRSPTVITVDSPE